MKKSLNMNFSSGGFGTSSVGISKAKEIWSELRHNIQEIYNNNVSKLSFEALYRNSYTLVLNRHGALLYNGVANEINSHLNGVANTLAAVPDALLLESLHACWLEHVSKLKIFRDFLMYMDKNYVISERKTVTYDLGLIIFHDQVIQHKEIRFRIRRILLDSVKAERNGEMIDRNLMRNSLSMLMALDRGTGLSNNNVVYRQEFEQPFLKESMHYYRAQSADLIAENSCMDYLRKVEAWLHQEKQRLDNYLDVSTSTPLMSIVEEELIAKHARCLIYGNGSVQKEKFKDEKSDDDIVLGEGGAGFLLKNDRRNDLALMYALFEKVPIAISELANFMYLYIVRRGESLLDDPSITKVPVKFVKNLLNIRSKFTEIVETSFCKDKLFQRKLKDAFEHFINADCRTAEFLSHFVDDLFKSGAREMSEEQVDAQLNEVVLIFRYIHDKDVFEMYYKKSLCKRLLNGRSISEDLERLMITKLKAECGVQFTSKLEGMFKDMQVSKDINSKYARWANTRKGEERMKEILEKNKTNQQDDDEEIKLTESRVSLTVTVLAQGVWPTDKLCVCHLPFEVEQHALHFRHFYLGSHNGRTLHWQSHLGTVELRTNYPSGRIHDFIVSTYQMSILMMFQTDEGRTFRQICTAMGVMEEDKAKIAEGAEPLERRRNTLDEIKRHLISICAPKYRLLKKEPKSRSIKPDDVFTFNLDFKDKRKKLRIPLVSIRRKKKSKSKDQNPQGEGMSMSGVPQKVADDRKYLVEAAVVRIMKFRKELEHNNLIAEVTKQLQSRFFPTPQLIKKRIESLIEREYLEKSEENERLYKYLA